MCKINSVFFIDDNGIKSSIFMNSIHRYFENVYEFSTAEKAFELFESINPQLIIIDIKDDKSTIFIKKFKSTNENCNVIVYTDIEDKDSLIECMNLGLDDYIIKPASEIIANNALIKTIKKIKIINHQDAAIELVDNFTWYPKSNSLIKTGEDNKKFDLTRKESELISILASTKHVNYTSELLMHLIYDIKCSTHKESSKLRAIVRRLRKKIGADIIVAKYKKGYSLNLLES